MYTDEKWSNNICDVLKHKGISWHEQMTNFTQEKIKLW